MWTAISLASAALIVSIVAFFSIFRGRRQVPPSQTTIQSTLERIREIGELCVLEVNFKEIVSHEKKGGFLASDGKMLLICEFTVEFRYDLRNIQFEKNPDGLTHLLVIPPHYYKVSTGEIKLYHEQKAAFLGLLPIDFSVEERNQIVAEARKAAEQQALASLNNIDRKIQMSAAATLKAIVDGCGVKYVEFKFLSPDFAAKQISDGMQNLLPLKSS